MSIYCAPTNKSTDGYGRDTYLRKQDHNLHSETHLLEIDLLREGHHTVAVPHFAVEVQGVLWNYLISLHRAGQGHQYQYWAVSLRSPLPRVYVPLTPEIPDAVLDLQACFERAYDAGPYQRRRDYREDPTPPLSAEDSAWAEQLLQTAGLR